MNINAKLKADTVPSFSGAPMGRADWGLAEHREHHMVMNLQRVKLIDGDYDLGGAYWGGGGEPLFCAWAEGIEARVFVRAKDRRAAKLKVNEHFRNAKFFR